MRKNSPRKWLHAILDLLPILIIPIFAININQKSVEPISIEVQINKRIDFNQQFKIQESTEDGGITYTSNDDGSYTLNGTATRTSAFYLIDKFPPYQQVFPYQHKMLVYGQTGDGNVYIQGYNSSIGQFLNNNDNTFEMPLVETSETFFRIRVSSGTTLNDYVITPMIFDLTQMYGVGNEPSYAEFEQNFYEDYYPYTLSQQMLINDYIATYNNTDIGSQFLYSLYKPINDYFNFNNLFNMNDVWNWIQLNLFQGKAPLPVFMIWNIIIYEFFMDLIFLFYTFFMFIIDVATNCLERPFNKIR